MCFKELNMQSSEELNTASIEQRHEELSSQHKVVVIGAAGKKGNDYLRVLMQRQDIIIAAVVINRNSSTLVDDLEKKGTIIIRDGMINLLIEKVLFNIAIVCVPHSEHFSITEMLLNAKKYVIKEKPLAFTIAQLDQYINLMRINNTLPIFTTVQRNTMPAYIMAKQELPSVGRIVNFQYYFWHNLTSITTGWRSKMATAFGGVILDMGYHVIDIILEFFDEINHVDSSFISYKYQETMQEELEDYAEIILRCKGNAFSGTLIIDRHGNENKDIFKIEGENRTIIVTPQGYKIFDSIGAQIKRVDCAISKEEVIMAMLNKAIPSIFNTHEIEMAFDRHTKNVQAIESIYACKQHRLVESSSDFSRNLSQLSMFTHTCSETTSPDDYLEIDAAVK